VISTSGARSLTFVACLLALSPSVAPAQGRPTSPEQRVEMYNQHVALTAASPFTHLPWQLLGPTNISGRMTDVAVVTPRGKSYTIYVAGAGGGVWRTVNDGVTWEPVFDQALSTSIGDVTVAPSDPNIVWIGTGEANIFRSSFAGAGVYKSTDGGETWQHMGLVGTHTIPRIVIHPTNPDIVYVAASGNEWTFNPERGVYKTTDGGRTWSKVFSIDDQTGAIDLVMDPSNPDRLYAAMWQRIRRPWNDPRVEPGFTKSGVYRTDDAGATWKPINQGLPSPEHRGRIGIDVARSNPNVVYAFVDNYEIARTPDPSERDAYGRPLQPVIKAATIFRSEDRGETWTRTSQENAYMERLGGTYGWVFGQIRVDPNNADKIYVLGLGLNVSEDRGRTFRQLSGMHGDHHGLWIDPANSNYLVNVNDGGVVASYDGGETWRQFTDNLPLSEFFNVGYDMGDPFRVYGSIQDIGSARAVVDLSRGRHSIPAVEWDNAPGGEGSIHMVDPTDPNTVYSAGYYGSIQRTNMATGETVQLAPKPPEGELPYRGQWLAPFIISAHNPRILYLGYQYLFRSMDRGDSWERISPDLTYNDPKKLGDIAYQTIFSIAESPLKFGLLYAGTDDGRVHVTRDGGQSWTEITSGLVPNRFIAEIVASKYAEGTVYLAQNGRRNEDFVPYIWKSTDYGRHWTSITANLPTGPVNVIKEDPVNANLLYVGTDIGAYVSIDGGRHWQTLGGGLPSAFVQDIIVHPRENILVAATHGRGMYALDVRYLQQLTGAVAASDLHLFDVDDVTVPTRGRGFGGFGRGGGGSTAFVAYWMKSAGPARITIKDRSGTVVRTLEGTGDAGFNSVVWDLTPTPQAGDAQSERMARFGMARRVQPGTYTIEVSAAGKTATGTLNVVGASD